MSKALTALACLILTSTATSAADAVRSGIDLQYLDSSVRPQDDLYRYVNGKWLDSAEIPPDRARFGTSDHLTDQTLDHLHTILDGLQTALDAGDADQPKLATLYASFMDEKKADKLRLKPLKAELARIDSLRSVNDIPSLMAHLNRIGVPAPYAPQVHLDARDSRRYVFDISQDGLGLPDRDYYLLEDARFVQIRSQYLAYMQTMLQMAGDRDAAAEAQNILTLETSLAKAQWNRVDNRNPVRTYNKIAIEDLGSLTPGYNWRGYLSEAGFPASIDYVIVSQPSYLAALNLQLDQTSLPIWKSYFRWHLLDDSAPLLSQDFVAEHFAFHGKVLRGTEQDQMRWKRAVALVSGSMGEALGRLYVTRHFPPESRMRVEQLVKNLLAAYRQDLDTLGWMGTETREKAQDKLSRFTYKIGYPSRWRDYSALRITKDDLFGNAQRANIFEYERNVHKLGKPVDRTEWRMSPQTVNAYYSPERNEIVFPAAILQPPYFDATADDAANYGGIGAVIGHEISHGFDDQGSQYDGNGNLLNPPGWFTEHDLEQFRVRTRGLVEQYAAYSPVAGYHLNGELTLGENIADNAGLAIAYKAYHLSLGDQPATQIDGLTGDQRFYMGWAQAWRGKTRESEEIRRIKVDPHSPPEVRGTAPVRNQNGFYQAFDVKSGDKMYLPPDQRISLW
ncbi:MAG TPA: M13 family metallopeptidase [Steroidobacteraceae bacterium]|jgi:predicted metalloendopeptidase|nr:M13 family metallopeptidase [Steroidobacteraceae bacterium]